MSIVDAEQYLFTSESVTEGHPDKMCDQISDAILDAFIRQDQYARVACETATTTGLVMVLGEISTQAEYIDVPTIVRDVVTSHGGRVWIADSPTGAEFHVRLPMIRPGSLP